MRRLNLSHDLETSRWYNSRLQLQNDVTLLSKLLAGILEDIDKKVEMLRDNLNETRLSGS